MSSGADKPRKVTSPEGALPPPKKWGVAGFYKIGQTSNIAEERRLRPPQCISRNEGAGSVRFSSTSQESVRRALGKYQSAAPEF